jgi:hypothetical protein
MKKKKIAPWTEYQQWKCDLWPEAAIFKGNFIRRILAKVVLNGQLGKRSKIKRRWHNNGIMISLITFIWTKLRLSSVNDLYLLVTICIYALEPMRTTFTAILLTGYHRALLVLGTLNSALLDLFLSWYCTLFHITGSRRYTCTILQCPFERSRCK